MLYRTLVGLIVSVPVLFCAMAFPAHAQPAADEPTGAFCALTGLELLGALDGSWTIHQGPGNARAGIMPVQLPAPPPTQVTFAFDPERRLVDVRGANLGDEMIMFPTAPVQQTAADLLVGEPPAEDQTAPVCAWLESPTLIGTNVYVAWNDDHWFLLQPGPGTTCQQIEENRAKPPADYDPLVEEIRERNRMYSDAFYNEVCRDALKPLPEGGTLEMEMTLVVRFSSANSGSGMVYFEGETDRSRFTASAPVRLTR